VGFDRGFGSLGVAESEPPDDTPVISFDVDSANVPEPASIGLSGFGLMALVGLRRRAQG
jgi:PEP-CTERM motif